MSFKMLVGLVLLHISCNAQSQKYLVLKHRDKPKEIAIVEGEFVVIRSFKGEKIRGPLEVVSEDLIRVKHKVVPLTNVQSFGKRNNKVMRVASTILSVGLNISVYGLSENLKNGWTNVLRQYFKNRPDELKELNQAVRATPAAGDDWQRVEGLKKLIKTMAEEKKIHKAIFEKEENEYSKNINFINQTFSKKVKSNLKEYG